MDFSTGENVCCKTLSRLSTLGKKFSRGHFETFFFSIFPENRLWLFMQIVYHYKTAEAVLTSIHNLCFWAEIRKIMYTPVNPSFTIQKWGLRGSKLYRYVFVMHWCLPQVHTSTAFSPSEWVQILNPSYQVAHWTWWWQCIAAWQCRSVWSLHCHSAADIGGLALSMAKSHWLGALHSTHELYIQPHVLKESGGKKELVAAPWTFSRRFSHILWLTVHSHRLLRACLLGSKRKLPPPVCQVWLGLPSVVCRPRGM